MIHKVLPRSFHICVFLAQLQICITVNPGCVAATPSTLSSILPSLLLANMDSNSMSYTTVSGRSLSRLYRDLEACRGSNRTFSDNQVQKLTMDASKVCFLFLFSFGIRELPLRIKLRKSCSKADMSSSSEHKTYRVDQKCAS